MTNDLRALFILGERVRWDLMWHKVSGQQRKLADLLVRLTFARGYESARIERLDEFGWFLGTGRSHVSEFLDELIGMKIVAVEGKVYRVLPRSSLHEWKVAMVCDPAEAMRRLDELSAVNGAQAEWWLPGKTIAQTVAEAEAVPETGTVPTWKAHVEAMRAVVEGRPRAVVVPETGTRAGAVVPVSGTSPVRQLTEQRLTASSKKQLNGDRLTERELMARIAAVVGEDDMARWGGDWRANWVRRWPEQLTAALNDLDVKRREDGFAPDTPGAWIKDLTRRFVGSQYQPPQRTQVSTQAAIGNGVGPSHDKTYG
jgi:hypothetical protein